MPGSLASLRHGRRRSVDNYQARYHRQLFQHEIAGASVALDVGVQIRPRSSCDDPHQSLQFRKDRSTLLIHRLYCRLMVLETVKDLNCFVFQFCTGPPGASYLPSRFHDLGIDNLQATVALVALTSSRSRGNASCLVLDGYAFVVVQALSKMIRTALTFLSCPIVREPAG